MLENHSGKDGTFHCIQGNSVHVPVLTLLRPPQLHVTPQYCWTPSSMDSVSTCIPAYWISCRGATSSNAPLLTPSKSFSYLQKVFNLLAPDPYTMAPSRENTFHKVGVSGGHGVKATGITAPCSNMSAIVDVLPGRLVGLPWHCLQQIWP